MHELLNAEPSVQQPMRLKCYTLHSFELYMGLVLIPIQLLTNPVTVMSHFLSIDLFRFTCEEVRFVLQEE